VALLIAPFAPGPMASRLLWAAYLTSVGMAAAVTALMLAGTLRPRALLLARRLAHLET
jgi:hypothetical protein